MTFAEKVLSYYASIKLHNKLPEAIQVMNPYLDTYTFELCSAFYKKFYNDSNQRIFIAGINPGRLGGGLTGIPFTDPVKLENECGIPNTLPKRTELSADFIYQMITSYGGTAKFYSQFFFGAVCPLGFTKEGKNLNYYDQKDLEASVRPFIIESLKNQLALGLNKEICFCLGEGKNYDYFQRMNQEHSFFKQIVPLPHPRFIMQYKRKKLLGFISLYIKQLQQIGQ